MANKKATMQPSSESINATGLKMVKNSSVFQERGIFFIRHYSTIIFAYNQKSKVAEINWNCSTTSNRMINRAIEFFNVAKDHQVDVSDDQIEKWSYSAPLGNEGY